MLRNNFRLKAISLIIAIVLSLTVKYLNDLEVERSKAEASKEEAVTRK